MFIVPTHIAEMKLRLFLTGNARFFHFNWVRWPEHWNIDDVSRWFVPSVCKNCWNFLKHMYSIVINFYSFYSFQKKKNCEKGEWNWFSALYPLKCKLQCFQFMDNIFLLNKKTFFVTSDYSQSSLRSRFLLIWNICWIYILFNYKIYYWIYIYMYSINKLRMKNEEKKIEKKNQKHLTKTTAL